MCVCVVCVCVSVCVCVHTCSLGKCKERRGHAQCDTLDR